MLKNFRRNLANAISPEKSQSYPFVELNWMSAERDRERALPSNHKFFEEENGRKASSDEEAIAFTKKYFDDLEASRADQKND